MHKHSLCKSNRKNKSSIKVKKWPPSTLTLKISLIFNTNTQSDLLLRTLTELHKLHSCLNKCCPSMAFLNQIFSGNRWYRPKYAYNYILTPKRSIWTSHRHPTYLHEYSHNHVIYWLVYDWTSFAGIFILKISLNKKKTLKIGKMHKNIR